MEVFNPTTGEWEEAASSVAVRGMRRRAEAHETDGLMYVERRTVLALLDLLEAAQALDAKYDGGTFGDSTYNVLASVFGDRLDKLHDVVRRFTDA